MWYDFCIPQDASYQVSAWLLVQYKFFIYIWVRLDWVYLVIHTEAWVTDVFLYRTSTCRDV